MSYYLQFVHILVAFLLVFTKYSRFKFISLANYTFIFFICKKRIFLKTVHFRPVFPLTYRKFDCKLVLK